MINQLIIKFINNFTKLLISLIKTNFGNTLSSIIFSSEIKKKKRGGKNKKQKLLKNMS